MTFSISCNNWLDLKPESGILGEDYWKTKEQLKAAVMGCYGSLLAPPEGGTSLAKLFFLWGELRADMLSPSLGTTSEEQSIMNVSIDPGNSIVNWSPVYQTINYCNTVIKHAPEAFKSDQTLTKEKFDSYMAEAKGLRALMYFYLVRSFKEVPLKLKPTDSDDDIKNLPKSSQEEVFNQIIKDLNDAEKGASLTYGNQAADKGRITRYTINAIQADVYLWIGDYSKCVSACNKIINSGKFGLIPSGEGWFTTLYRDGNSNESIFEFQFDRQKLNPFYNMFGSGNKEFIAANRVMDIVYTTPDPDDPDVEEDIRADGGSLRADDGTIWKYIGENRDNMISSDGSFTHWFVYRYPDILLMKAEALAQIGGRGQDALDLVKRVRDRANALPGTNEEPDPENKNGVTRFILDERAREFMFEGKRWYDILRYIKRDHFEHLDYLLNMVPNLVTPEKVNTTKAKFRNPNSLYFPIYQDEIETNKNLKQNPFYE